MSKCHRGLALAGLRFCEGADFFWIRLIGDWLKVWLGVERVSVLQDAFLNFHPLTPATPGIMLGGFPKWVPPCDPVSASRHPKQMSKCHKRGTNVKSKNWTCARFEHFWKCFKLHCIMKDTMVKTALVYFFKFTQEWQIELLFTKSKV